MLFEGKGRKMRIIYCLLSYNFCIFSFLKNIFWIIEFIPRTGYIRFIKWSIILYWNNLYETDNEMYSFLKEFNIIKITLHVHSEYRVLNTPPSATKSKILSSSELT